MGKGASGAFVKQESPLDIQNLVFPFLFFYILWYNNLSI